MKVKLITDEWTVLYVAESIAQGGIEVEVTQEQLNKWNAALDAFETAQKEMVSQSKVNKSDVNKAQV